MITARDKQVWGDLEATDEEYYAANASEGDQSWHMHDYLGMFDDELPVTGGLYFAYGANLDKLGMQVRCPAAVPVSRAWLPNWQLQFKGVCDIEQAEGDTVHGALWSITKNCERSLDSFEGAPDFYRKERVTVMTPNGPYEAMVYIMNTYKGWTDYLSLPNAGYYNTVLNGYRDFDLPEPALWSALDRIPEPPYVPATVKNSSLAASQEDWENGVVVDARVIDPEDDSILNTDWEEVDGVYVDDLYDDGDAYEAGLLDAGKSPATLAMEAAEREEIEYQVKKALDRSDAKDKLTRLRERLAARKRAKELVEEPVMDQMAQALLDGAQ
jgi:gamma-glutamylcyclotransferase (GGCT)/AIG2-like uncharacterized protein YtfP